LIGTQSDGKACSCAGLAGRFDRAAVRVHNRFGNGEAESAASGRTRSRFIGAIKSLNDVREVFGKSWTLESKLTGLKQRLADNSAAMEKLLARQSATWQSDVASVKLADPQP
jgi:hypothetical protein